MEVAKEHTTLAHLPAAKHCLLQNHLTRCLRTPCFLQSEKMECRTSHCWNSYLGTEV